MRHARIARRYSDGDPIAEIAKTEGVDRKTVRNVARRAGLPLRRPPRAERNSRIVRDYEAGSRVGEIAMREGVRPSYVSGLLTKAGISRRPDRRRYPLDENAFDHLDPIGWWLVGLLAADGSINPTEHRISLAQRYEDRGVLEAFLEYVGSLGRPLTEIRGREGGWSKPDALYLEARVYSAHMCEVLSRHGIVPGKTRSMRFGPEAAVEPAVWLGLLDGDGSILVKPPCGETRIDFFGAAPAMDQCAEFWGALLRFRGRRRPTVIQHARHLFKVSLYSQNAVQAARVLLDSTPTSMARKRHKLEQIARRPTPSEN